MNKQYNKNQVMSFILPAKKELELHEKNLYYDLFLKNAKARYRYYETNYREIRVNNDDNYWQAYKVCLSDNLRNVMATGLFYTLETAVKNFNVRLGSVIENSDKRFIKDWIDDTHPSENNSDYLVVDRTYIMVADFKNTDVFVNRLFVKKEDGQLFYIEPSSFDWKLIPDTLKFTKFYIRKSLYHHIASIVPDARGWSKRIQIMIQNEEEEAGMAGLPLDAPENETISLRPWGYGIPYKKISARIILEKRLQWILEEIKYFIDTQKKAAVKTMLRSIAYYTETDYFFKIMHNYVYSSVPFLQYSAVSHQFERNTTFVDPWIMEYVNSVLNQAPGIDHEIVVRRVIVRETENEPVHMYQDGKDITGHVEGDLDMLTEILIGKTIVPWKNQIISVAYADEFDFKTQYKDNIYCLLTLPPKTPATCLAPLQFDITMPVKNLHEWILPINSHFRVDKIEKQENSLFIYMTYVGIMKSWSTRLSNTDFVDLIVKNIKRHEGVRQDDKSINPIVTEIKTLVEKA